MLRCPGLAALFLGIYFSQLALADKPDPAPHASKPQVQAAVDRGTKYLQAESAAWLKTRVCASCHHASMPLWSLYEADRMGYSIDKKFVAETTEATLGSMDKMIARKLVPGPKDPPDTRPIGRGLNMGLVFMAVAARSSPALNEGQKQSLNWITDQILKKQMKDGSWEFFLSRPPINETQLTDTSWILMALQGDARASGSEQERTALKKGLAWLADAKLPDTYESKVLKLLLALRLGKARSDLQPQINELLALQQPNGGWRQLPEMKSDAFATGQTLYVLALAGYSVERPEIKRAIDFLISTQKPDGSWPMTSRSTPDGRPGSAKLLTPITCAASAWATLGLSRLVPKS
jgi:Squalene-hopene cyclase C-terminal domain/Prenyltransferase and squalene oxidase repeat